jgi:nitrite reductase/ring-hydroxylating ferredoxin subunit
MTNPQLTDNQQKLIEEAVFYKPFKIEIEGKSICVVKTEDRIYGISNKCPHAGASLHYGFCSKKLIISCPLHGYKFDMKTGKSADGNNYKLTNYEWKVENGKLKMA